MAFLQHLEERIRDERPGWTTERSDDGSALLIREAGVAEGTSRPSFFVREVEGGVLLEDLWRIPLTAGQEEALDRLLIEYMEDGIENHGWEVPVVLQGGPQHGRRLSKQRQDLVGRLLFARPAGPDGRGKEAHVYKWRLKRSPDGSYACVYERTLAGAEVDAFIARGVGSTGPFVLIRDRRAEPDPA
ncbi:MAG: hypothetical protein ACC662_09555 [Planctomycetota bacterium]